MLKLLGWAVLIIIVIVAGTLIIFRTPDTDPAEMRAKYGGSPSQYVDLGGGLTVHLRDTGPRDAPVLVLIHGSNASLHTWEPWAERLGNRYRVIRFDLPGHGLTGANPTHRYATTDFVDVVERLRAKLGLTRFALVGNSMGGGFAWHYALAHPGRVAALILVDSVGQPEPGSQTPPLAFRIARMPVIRNLATVVTPRSLIADGLPQAYANPKLADDKAIDLYWELLRYPGNREATIERFATPSDPATPALLKRLRMPVLILWGAQDHLIPVSSAQWLHANIPGSKLIVYPNTGHIPMEERADQSAADVRAFLQGANPAN
ncbi:MAG: alpha/beta hydrolase [Sphingomonas sp.]|uniref:alpha/beta fold hydrolase n=1 Tax=Sphingomonas sp. TaxID=28214 RepID=UPI0025D4EAA8|nr:alpha/beta hydrolase [Sphingomonas sp.]MBY0283615.1 alpha/beta hydrolase [Sphingomonas sp.]